MAQTTIERRNLLRGAGITAGGVVVTGMGAALAPATAHSGHRHRDLDGSWLAAVSNDDGSSLTSVISFADGDVCIVHDISPAGPPLTGTWKEGDDNRFRATVITGFPGDEGPGSAGPTLTLKLRGRLKHGKLIGSFTFVVVDPTGAEIATGSGTFEATRIEA